MLVLHACLCGQALRWDRCVDLIEFPQVCTTTPCMLRGAYDILDVCKKHLGVGVGGTCCTS